MPSGAVFLIISAEGSGCVLCVDCVFSVVAEP